MLAATFFGKHDVRIGECPVPDIGDDEILVRVAACGICGTDVHIYEGEVPLARLPVIAGHEFCGTVERIGRAVTDVALGDKVAIEPNLFCGRCHYCRTGRKHFCAHWAGIGLTRNGGFAQFAAVPSRAAYKMPQELSFKHGAFFEPVACVLHGIERVGLMPGDTVVVCGAGSIGLLFIQLLKRAGAGRIVVSDPDSVKLAVARQLGADVVVDPTETDLKETVMDNTNGLGADVAIDASGMPEAISSLFGLVQHTGRILLFGVTPEEAEIRVRPFDIYRRELTLLGSFTNPYTNEAALNLLGSLNLDMIVTHQIRLSQLVQDGIQAIRRKTQGVIKVQVVFE
jgi:2-desacetyl-2-hydroxyethyl bacteriochlorophyllide A dehydrogenase